MKNRQSDTQHVFFVSKSYLRLLLTHPNPQNWPFRKGTDALEFPRHGTSQDNPVRDVPLSLCPGTKIFPCPAVPLSRDKGRGKNHRQKSRDKLLCPGTSRNKITYPKNPKKQEKDVLKQRKDALKQEGMFYTEKVYSKTGKGVAKQEIIGKKLWLSRPIPSWILTEK